MVPETGPRHMSCLYVISIMSTPLQGSNFTETQTPTGLFKKDMTRRSCVASRFLLCKRTLS